MFRSNRSHRQLEQYHVGLNHHTVQQSLYKLPTIPFTPHVSSVLNRWLTPDAEPVGHRAVTRLNHIARKYCRVQNHRFRLSVRCEARTTCWIRVTILIDVTVDPRATPPHRGGTADFGCGLLLHTAEPPRRHSCHQIVRHWLGHRSADRLVGATVLVCTCRAITQTCPAPRTSAANARGLGVPSVHRPFEFTPDALA